jgi:hypothetical protein
MRDLYPRLFEPPFIEPDVPKPRHLDEEEYRALASPRRSAGRAATEKAGAVGHPYRVRIDFESGRYSFCKIAGYALYKSETIVTVPRACGGT